MGWFRKGPKVEPAEKPRTPTHYLYRIGLTPVGDEWEWEAHKVPVYEHMHEGRGKVIGKGKAHKRHQAQASARQRIESDKAVTEARGATQWEHIQ